MQKGWTRPRKCAFAYECARFVRALKNLTAKIIWKVVIAWGFIASANLFGACCKAFNTGVVFNIFEALVHREHERLSQHFHFLAFLARFPGISRFTALCFFGGSDHFYECNNHSCQQTVKLHSDGSLCWCKLVIFSTKNVTKGLTLEQKLLAQCLSLPLAREWAPYFMWIISIPLLALRSVCPVLLTFVLSRALNEHVYIVHLATPNSKVDCFYNCNY